MNREILFRAWDKQRREYLSSGSVLIAIQPGKNPKNTIYLDILKDPDTYKNRFELEQYTGLHDGTRWEQLSEGKKAEWLKSHKQEEWNGTKIFEGDICKDRRGWVFEVLWDNENARFIGCQSKPRGDTYICYVGREPAVEIIGNIHDNPELIKEGLK